MVQFFRHPNFICFAVIGVIDKAMCAESTFSPITTPAGHIGQNGIRHQIFFQRQLVKGGANQLLIRQGFYFGVVNNLFPAHINQVGNGCQRFAGLEMGDQLFQRFFPFRDDDAVKKLLKQGLLVVQQIAMAVEYASTDNDVQVPKPFAQNTREGQAGYNLSDVNDG